MHYQNMLAVVALSLFVFLPIIPAEGQETEDPYPEGWQGPKIYEMIFAARGQSRLERATNVMNWMESNDWRSIDLELSDIYNLYETVNLDALEYSQFSVRWSGFVTAPRTGVYTIKQAQDFSGHNSQLKIAINGRVVLNSNNDQPSETKHTSLSISLVSGEAIPIQVDLVHNVPYPIGSFSGGAPMALLTWKTEEGVEEIIPSSSFTPPEGFVSEATHGLMGEYYRTSEFSDLCLTRLDPALDLAWSVPPVAGLYHEQATECLEMCKVKVLDGNYLEQSMAEGVDSVFDYNLWRIAYRMTGTERQRLVDILLSRPEMLSEVSTRAMARLTQAFYMLPGDKHITLLGEWSVERPQPRSLAGSFPGWSEGSYQQLNTDFYWLMGLFKQGPYWEQVEQLWDEYLVLPNGECNLTIAYLTAYATREESHNRDARHMSEFYNRIQAQLDNEQVVGDVRVSWLLARTFVDEIQGGDHPRLLPDSKYLTEARLVAESPYYQNWVMQEIAVRLAAQGNVSSLEELLSNQVGETAEKRDQMNHWRAIAASQVESKIEKKKQESLQSDLAVVSELERRLAKAQQNKDASDIERYQRLLDSAQPEIE